MNIDFTLHASRFTLHDVVTTTDILNDAKQRLADAGIETPRLDAEVLLAHALSVGRADLCANSSMAPSDDAASCFASFIERRAGGCPVAYITGVKEFWSIPIKVTRDVLIPRPETEHVVERALEIIKTNHESRITNHDEIVILDLCTGSGCIAAAVAKELPAARFVLTDINNKALDVARTNLAFAADRVEFRCGDLFEAVSGPGQNLFDLVVSNPPYIPTDDIGALSREIAIHEPRTALDGGETGLDFARRIIEDAPAFLKPDGMLVMEMGAGQAKALDRIAREHGAYDEIEISKDLAGIERIICLWKNSSSKAAGPSAAR